MTQRWLGSGQPGSCYHSPLIHQWKNFWSKTFFCSILPLPSVARWEQGFPVLQPPNLGDPKQLACLELGVLFRDHSDISTNTIYSISLLSPTSSAHKGLEPTSSTLEGQMNGHRWICLSCVMNCQILPTVLMPYVLWRNIHNG